MQGWAPAFSTAKMATDRTPTPARESSTTRASLLDAAARMFAEHGYNAATTRRIAAAAGVDAALIARYFGSKEGLYLAVVEASRSSFEFQPAPASPELYARTLLARWLQNGGEPVAASIVRPQVSERARKRLIRLLQDRFLTPFAASLPDPDRERAALTAELVAAALAGIALARSTGSLSRVEAASEEAIAEVVAEILHLGSAPSSVARSAGDGVVGPE